MKSRLYCSCFFLALIFAISMAACSESMPSATDEGGDLLAASSDAANKRGGGKPAGTIYLVSEGTTYSVDGNGGNLTDVGVTGDEIVPSRELHGPDSTRWFAVTKYAGERFPDGTSRFELFLENEGALISIQITNEANFAVQNPNWLPGDTLLSFAGYRMEDNGDFIEGGIYTLPIPFVGDGVSITGSPSLVLSGEDLRRPHDFSPHGDKIVVCRSSDYKIVIFDRTSGAIIKVLPTSCGVYGTVKGWSVLDEILFSKSGAIYGWGIARIKADGSEEVNIVMPKGYSTVNSAYWSPDGNYIVYGYQKNWTGQKIYASSYRIDRNGRGKTRVDGDLGGNHPVGWR